MCSTMYGWNIHLNFAFFLSLASRTEMNSPTAVVPQTCHTLKCENNSPCKITEYTSEGKSVTSAECVCQGNWFGPHCEAQLLIAAESISAGSVDIKINFNTETSSNSVSHAILEKYLEYTLQYWSNSSGNACILIPKIKSRVYKVEGLNPGSRYYFCAKTDNSESLWCNPPVAEDSLITANNCLVLSTRKFTPGSGVPALVLPMSIVVVFLLVIAIVLALVFRRKYCAIFTESKLFSRISQSVSRQRKRRGKRRDKEMNLELFLMPESPSPERPSLNTPSSPGRPKNRLSKRTRGFASFAARNEKTIALTTVIEYTPDETSDLLATSLSVPSQETGPI